MSVWNIPGAAVGVVMDDDVLLARGFGQRSMGSQAAVDENTVFGIGSTTKAFTAATEAIIIDRGKMAWSDRVLDHFTEFRLFDSWVTREFRVLDLLAQRSGMRPYVFDTMWGLGFGADQMIAALRYARPVSSFRTTFAYQNILHAVAGKIVARYAATPDWNTALQELILDPLGMTSTSSTIAGLERAANHATGHARIGGTLQPLAPPPIFDAVGPAGAVNASVADILKWLRLQIGRGSFEGKRIISEANLVETWRPRVEMPGLPGFPANGLWYASGWIFHLTANGRAVWHNGGTGLIKAHVGFLPDLRVGFVMLTNEGENGLQDATGLWFYDRVLGNPEVDYSAEYKSKRDAAKDKAQAAIRPSQPPRSPGPLADYAGRYSSPVLQAVSIDADKDALRIAFAATGRDFLLRSWDGEIFRLDSEDRLIAASLSEDGSPVLLQFRRDPAGKVAELRFLNEAELILSRQA